MKCPVCEHEQEFGFECDVCGKALGGLDGLGAPPVQDERVEGLEQTALPELPGAIPLPPMSDLERTENAPAGEVAVSALDEMETTAAPKMDVTVEKMPDMSEDRAADDGVRTVIQPGFVTCRFCRKTQPEREFCDLCHNPLPKYVPPPAPGSKSDTVVTRCKSCGAPGLAGAKCGECGRTIVAAG